MAGTRQTTRWGQKTSQQPRQGWGGAVYAPSSFRRSSSGSLAMLAAMRRASSRVSSLAAERRTGFVLAPDDERLGVLLHSPGQWEVASGWHGARIARPGRVVLRRVGGKGGPPPPTRYYG